jgi:hypothetical protein
MTEQEAIDALKEHKKLIDKKYLKARNSKAIEVVLNAIKEKDKIIDLMSDEIESLHSSLIGEFGEWTTKYCQGGEETTIEEIKQYFENEALKD